MKRIHHKYITEDEVVNSSMGIDYVIIKKGTPFYESKWKFYINEHNRKNGKFLFKRIINNSLISSIKFKYSIYHNGSTELTVILEDGSNVKF